jgi:hypothetical protein
MPLAVALDLDSFHLFPKLAPELQLKTWYEALPDPAIVEIDFCGATQQWYRVTESLGTPCGLLRACKDSRETYLKHYVTLFEHIRPAIGTLGTQYPGGRCERHVSISGATTYFSPLVDILYIGGNLDEEYSISKEALQSLQKMRGLEKLRFLGCEFAELMDGIDNSLANGHSLHPLSFFSSLEEFTVVVCDYNYWDISEGVYRPHGQIEWFGAPSPSQGDQNEILAIEGMCKGFFAGWEEVKHGGSTSPLPKLTITRLTRGGQLQKSPL